MSCNWISHRQSSLSHKLCTWDPAFSSFLPGSDLEHNQRFLHKREPCNQSIRRRHFSPICILGVSCTTLHLQCYILLDLSFFSSKSLLQLRLETPGSCWSFSDLLRARAHSGVILSWFCRLDNRESRMRFSKLTICARAATSHSSHGRCDYSRVRQSAPLLESLWSRLCIDRLDLAICHHFGHTQGRVGSFSHGSRPCICARTRSGILGKALSQCRRLLGSWRLVEMWQTRLYYWCYSSRLVHGFRYAVVVRAKVLSRNDSQLICLLDIQWSHFFQLNECGLSSDFCWR